MLTVHTFAKDHRGCGTWDTAPVLMVLSILATGCGQGDTPSSPVSRYDSAGVVIVENGSTSPSDGGEWRVGPNPVLSIGTIEGEAHDQLFQVAGVRRISDGRIAIVNAGSHQVRIFGPEGTFLRSFGDRGSGPEEFEMPALAGAVGDTLIIVDRAHHRLTFVHPDEGLVGLVRVSDEVGGFLNPAGSFANGQTVFGGAFDMRRTGEMKNGMNRAGTFYRSCDLSGFLAADFGDKPGAEFFIRSMEAEGRAARPAVIPFARIPVATVSPHFLFFSAQDRYEIEVFEPSGRLVRLIRMEHDPIPVTAEDGRRHIDGVLEQVGRPDQEAEIRAHLASLPLPDHFPPHGRLLADDLDYLWVEEYQRPGAETRAWNIFDPEGVLVARANLPGRFNPTQIGRHFILGLGWDEMNVEYVRMYRLTR